MSTPAAIDNRRENRRLRNAAPLADALSPAERREEREIRQRAVVARLIKKHFPGASPTNLMLLDYRYWQARRCGWDYLKMTDRRGPEFWRWWVQLHPGQRDHLVILSRKTDWLASRAFA